MSNIVHGRQNTELYRLLYTKSEGFIGRFQNPIATIPYNFDATQEFQTS